MVPVVMKQCPVVRKVASFSSQRESWTEAGRASLGPEWRHLGNPGQSVDGAAAEGCGASCRGGVDGLPRRALQAQAWREQLLGTME